MNFQPIDYTGDLPVLTEIIGDSPAMDLPILTEVVAERVEESLAEVVVESAVDTAARTHELTAAEMQLLLQHLEAHLETVFTGKLSEQLGQLQKLAVDLAVSELKTELPQLLRDALK